MAPSNSLSTAAKAGLLLLAELLGLLALYGFDRYRPRPGAAPVEDSHQQVRQLARQVEKLQARHEQLTRALNGRPLVEDDVFVADGRSLQAAPSNTSCECTLPAGPTYASSFGVTGDAATDDGPALQAAIDSAASNLSGGTVILPKGTFRINQSLEVPGGVTLQGQGYGSSPLAIQFDAGGSTIAYCGTDHAVKLTGHAASLRDLAVYDWPYTGCENTQAAGGVLVEADQALVESVIVSNVFIYYFLGGPALSLVAKNNGGVPFGNYQNVRIRHAKTGIYLSAEEGSFVK